MKPSKIQVEDEVKFADIKEWYDTNLHPAVLDLDDQEVYKHVYEDGNWAAIFQCTEIGAQRFMQRVRPRSIIDIAAATSIYRPGPLTANVDKDFVEDKNNAEAGIEKQYIHPVVKEVLDETYGHMIFQENFMILGNKLGDLSWDDCDKLRKILVKKSIGTDVNEQKMSDSLKIKTKFVAGAMAKGMSEKQVNEFWERMQAFSGYGFNKCLHPLNEIKIYNKNGKYLREKMIYTIVPGEYVQSRDENTKKEIYIKVKALHHNGIIPVVEYTFDNGEKVKCTPNHKFRTTCGQMLPIQQIVDQNLDVVSVTVEKDITKTV